MKYKALSQLINLKLFRNHIEARLTLQSAPMMLTTCIVDLSKLETYSPLVLDNL